MLGLTSWSSGLVSCGEALGPVAQAAVSNARNNFTSYPEFVVFVLKSVCFNMDQDVGPQITTQELLNTVREGADHYSTRYDLPYWYRFEIRRNVMKLEAGLEDWSSEQAIGGESKEELCLSYQRMTKELLAEVVQSTESKGFESGLDPLMLPTLQRLVRIYKLDRDLLSSRVNRAAMSAHLDKVEEQIAEIESRNRSFEDFFAGDIEHFRAADTPFFLRVFYRAECAVAMSTLKQDKTTFQSKPAWKEYKQVAIGELVRNEHGDYAGTLDTCEYASYLVAWRIRRIKKAVENLRAALEADTTLKAFATSPLLEKVVRVVSSEKISNPGFFEGINRDLAELFGNVTYVPIGDN